MRKDSKKKPRVVCGAKLLLLVWHKAISVLSQYCWEGTCALSFNVKVRKALGPCVRSVVVG